MHVAGDVGDSWVRIVVRGAVGEHAYAVRKAGSCRWCGPSWRRWWTSATACARTCAACGKGARARLLLERPLRQPSYLPMKATGPFSGPHCSADPSTLKPTTPGTWPFSQHATWSAIEPVIPDLDTRLTNLGCCAASWWRTGAGARSARRRRSWSGSLRSIRPRAPPPWCATPCTCTLC